MVGPPPISPRPEPLFPYTPLFRSGGGGGAAGGGGRRSGALPGVRRRSCGPARNDPAARPPAAARAAVPALRPCRLRPREDAGNLGLRELGRASCRERVCQYV